MILIKSKKEGFRRCGVAHTVQGQEFADDFFSQAQLVKMEDEPMLDVSLVPVSPLRLESDEEARKVLNKMTNARLKADCDELGIKYPANAVKTELVDQILANTAPAPEE